MPQQNERSDQGQTASHAEGEETARGAARMAENIANAQANQDQGLAAGSGTVDERDTTDVLPGAADDTGGREVGGWGPRNR